jgi:predicted DNA-binding antitoxin AbrB/MazE fold protein
MTTPIRAVYEEGQLRLLDPVDLVEGQKVKVMIVDERALARMALGDLIAGIPMMEGDEIDEAALAAEIEAGFARPLSEIIIEERREGR